MKKDNILHIKSYKFAIRIVKLSQFLVHEKKEYILSKQILRSGTSIGALVSESKFAQSTADFINKLMVSLKEANETQYWINLLHDTNYITTQMHKSLLVSITKTLKNKGI